MAKDQIILKMKLLLYRLIVIFYATSFFEFVDDKTTSLNKYWGDDGVAHNGY